MSDAQFIRKRFRFETEYGQHRNWWVRDPRIAGNPLSIYLYLLSHDPEHMPTQNEAMKELGIGRSAWLAAKEKLLRSGFLLEIRDRYPSGAMRDGKPCGGQKRFRLELLDPEPGAVYELDDVVLELDHPLDEYKGIPDQSQCTKHAVDESSQCTKRAVDEKPLVGASARFVQWGQASAQNVQSFIGREKDRKDWIINPSIPSDPSEVDAGARDVVEPAEAGLIDEQLAAIDPRLTVVNIERELAGRVDVSQIDLVAACTEILAAHRQPEGLRWPPAYVAKSIVANPERWQLGQRPLPPNPSAPSAHDARLERERAERAACAAGDHDWGPAFWPEFDRNHCLRLRCQVTRRSVDAGYAALEEAEFEFERGL